VDTAFKGLPDADTHLDTWLVKLMKKPAPPTAFFCYDDTLAIHLINGLEKLGIRVPEDVAVVGYDDLDEAAHFKPALTTVNMPVGEMCTVACKIVADYVEGVKMGKMEVVLEDELVIRESCGYFLKPKNRKPKTGNR
jgi:DNA-binding LacI/PurR family transcriptional regulator